MNFRLVGFLIERVLVFVFLYFNGFIIRFTLPLKGKLRLDFLPKNKIIFVYQTYQICQNTCIIFNHKPRFRFHVWRLHYQSKYYWNRWRGNGIERIKQFNEYRIFVFFTNKKYFLTSSSRIQVNVTVVGKG